MIRFNRLSFCFYTLIFMMISINFSYGIDLEIYGMKLDEIVKKIQKEYEIDIINTVSPKDKISMHVKDMKIEDILKKIALQLDISLWKKRDTFILGNLTTGSVLLNVKFSKENKLLFTVSKLVGINESFEIGKDSFEIEITPELIGK